MYFCEDVDLMGWEPGIFLQGGASGAFGHQAIIREVSATLTGTALVMGAAVLGGVLPGMVAVVVLADGSLTQLLEIVTVTDTSHATVRAPRGAGEAAIGPLVGGSVKVTVVSFRPQIAAVGDSLLSLIGVASDRDTDTATATADLTGFRMAAVFGTLAALFRTLAAAENATSVTLSKLGFYERMAGSSRRRIEGLVDMDGDGVAETRVSGSSSVLVRE